MTIEEFGRQVKNKYPEYKDVDDALLGQKMLEKYPNYKDRIDQPNQSEGLQYQEGDNPIMFGAAKLQEKLQPTIDTFKNTDTLPIVGGLVGQGVGGPVGAGAGVAGGTALKGLFNEGDTPIMDILKPAAETTATSATLGAIFSPFKTTGKVRDFLLSKNPKLSVDGNLVVKALDESYKNMPSIIKTKAVETAYKRAVKEFKNKTFNAAEAMVKKLAQGNVGWLSSGNEARGAISDLAKTTQKAIRESIRSQSSALGATDDVFSALYRVKKSLQLPARIGVGMGIGKVFGKLLGTP